METPYLLVEHFRIVKLRDKVCRLCIHCSARLTLWVIFPDFSCAILCKALLVPINMWEARYILGGVNGERDIQMYVLLSTWNKTKQTVGGQQSAPQLSPDTVAVDCRPSVGR